MHVAPALAVALAAIACGGTVATSPAHDGGGGDGAAIDDSGSIPDSGTPDAPACATGDAACNSLEVCGPEIMLANMMTPAPQPAGGTIADGTYVETAATFYPTGTQTITSGPVRATLQIETTGPGAGMLVVQEISEQGWSAPATYMYTIAVKSPTDLAWASTCGDGARLDTPFTATPQSLQLFYDEGMGIGTVVETYTRQ
jgi:hypothetical protein